MHTAGQRLCLPEGPLHVSESFVPFIIPAGAFQTIRSAYQSSSSASSLAAGAPALLARARESRRSAAGLQGDLAGDTAKLLALKGELASAPDLTPVINQVKMQSRFFSAPHGVCVVFRGSHPAALHRPRHSRAGALSRHTRLENWLGGSGIPRPCPAPLPAVCFSLRGLFSCHFLCLQDPLDFWMRFLSFLLRCFIAMEIHSGVCCCGDHQAPLSAAGGTGAF